MLNLDHYFRCEVVVDDIDLVLDLSPLQKTKSVWIIEKKVLLLEYKEKVLPETFQNLWEKITVQSDKILSATMYEWDPLDQHPGHKTEFKINNYDRTN